MTKRELKEGISLFFFLLAIKQEGFQRQRGL
jgi:hypothetical protein